MNIKKDIIDSPDYRRRIDKVSENKKVNRSVWNIAKEMLNHRSGTKFEDLAFIDSVTGKSIINKGYDKENRANPNKAMKKMLEKAPPYTIIGVHNHPGSKVPSIPDFKVCISRKYKFGIVVCHDGKIYKYSVDGENFNEPMATSALAKLQIKGYNENIYSRFKDAGVEIEVL